MISCRAGPGAAGPAFHDAARGRARTCFGGEPIFGLRFITEHLDPADRIGEILFGLIMALGFTGAVRLGVEETSSRELFLAILGCNVAWGIVDGVMHTMTTLFQRARALRLARAVRRLTDARALALLRRELDGGLEWALSEDERDSICRRLLDSARRTEPPPVKMRADDLMGGAAVAAVIVMMTLPVVVPFALIGDPYRAARLSNAIALAMLFLLGMRWGGFTGLTAWRCGLAMTGVGIALVAVTIALGG